MIIAYCILLGITLNPAVSLVNIKVPQSHSPRVPNSQSPKLLTILLLSKHPQFELETEAAFTCFTIYKEKYKFCRIQKSDVVYAGLFTGVAQACLYKLEQIQTYFINIETSYN